MEKNNVAEAYEQRYMSNAEINDIIIGSIGSMFRAGKVPRDF
jgi:hypothetical protein